MNTAAKAGRRVDWRLVLVVVALAVLALVFLTSNSLGSSATLTTDSGSHRISVEIADTPETQRTGLMNREELAEDHGMLFDFQETRPVSMWMKNTLIPLDMLFIREDGTIARIARNARPLSLETIPSGEPVRYVLELNGGAASEYDAKVGDRLVHPIIAGSQDQ